MGELIEQQDSQQEQIQQRIQSEEPIAEVQVEGAEGWKAAVPASKVESIKQTRKKIAANKGGAKTSVGDTIARMEEKINMMRYIDGLSVGDIPAATKLSKDGREQLVQFQKDVEALKLKYITSIQKQ